MTTTTREPTERIPLTHEPAARSRPSWWLVPLLAVLCAAAAFAWTQANPREHLATAEILVTPIGADDQTFLGVPALRQSGDTARTVQTAAGLIDSTAAARRAAEELGEPWTGRVVRDRTTVQALGASTLVAVTAQTEDRADAIRLANAFATSALAVRRERLAGPLRASISQVLSQIRRQRGRDSDYRDHLRTKLDSLRVAQQTGDPSLSLAQRAAITERAGVPPLLLVLAALVAGAMLGAVALLLTQAVREAGRDTL